MASVRNWGLKLKRIRYKANPTAAKFHASDKVCRGIMGPVGNGKSVASIMEGLRLSRDQWPNSEGIRKSRGVIVRNTNPELRTTTLNTWKQWIPEQIAPVAMNPIITCKMREGINDGTSMELEVYFLAMDKDDDVKKLLSLECTWIFLNEVRELPYSVVKGARERIGRYPSLVDGYEDVYEDGKLIYAGPRDDNGEYMPCKRKALLMDTNPPDDDHWWYQLAEEGCLRKSANKDQAKKETERIFDFFRGPPPLFKNDDGTYRENPKAENIGFLPGGYQYYKDMIAGNTQDHIDVMVLGNYGVIKEGRPVYAAYNDLIHCPEAGAKAISDLPICLGWDFGLTPACVVGQLTSTGQMRVIAEMWTDDMFIREFARDIVKPFLQQYFSKFEIGFSLADPAGNNRGEGEGTSAIGILNDEYPPPKGEDPLDMGFYTEAAPTNDPTKRIDAVSRFMSKMIEGQPGYVLNKACKLLRKGKNGGYSYKRVAVASSEERYRDKPDKNKYSHSSDAEQYLALGFVGGYVNDKTDDYEEDDYSEVSAMGY